MPGMSVRRAEALPVSGTYDPVRERKMRSSRSFTWLLLSLLSVAFLSSSPSLLVLELCKLACCKYYLYRSVGDLLLVNGLILNERDLVATKSLAALSPVKPGGGDTMAMRLS